ncbi:Protein HemY [Zhongshania aliphaticivorans]|uniref:Protein HemY n=1 Tax=Zhongshania aliphaticivorans TaxID=1470434 RepID=A0A5S9PFG1_9GAMM|nr:heme biosynthesis protein HemY [Zhongshania aliphaticivorans]CAA0102362.1 Protein HemY [Zhongshania aliphaticivorans]CAA0114370.1 Protein HemY [Zhongshania aliphaticivorans]
MKIFIAILLTLVVAAGLAAAIQYDPGYILIAYGQTTVEMTIWVGLAVLAIVIILFFIVFISLRRGAKVSDNIGSFWSNRRARRGRSHTTLGMIAFIEGNWERSRRLLTDALKGSDAPLINYLLAARASHALGDTASSRRYLGLAEETSAKASIAVALTQAEMQVDNGRLEEALATLTRARRNAQRHPSVLILLKKVYLGLSDWSSLLELLPDLRKHNILPAEKIDSLERQSLMGQLEQAASQTDVAAVQQWWKQVPKLWQKDTDLVLSYARSLSAIGEDAEAEKVIRQALKQNWSSELVLFYGRVAGSDLTRQLSTAEAWQKEHGADPALLFSLGRLSLRNELWEKAKNYFEQSYRLAPSAELGFELGRLLSNMGALAESEQYTQQALELQGQSLPSLPQPRLAQ